MSKVIEESLIPYPMENRTRNGCIPIIYAFFTYLSEEKLLLKADEIAEYVLSLQENMVTTDPTKELSNIELMLLRSILKSSIDPDDDEAVKRHIEKNMGTFIAELLRDEDPDSFDKFIGNGSFSSDNFDNQARKPVDISSIPIANGEWFVIISELTDRFCDERLDSEYIEICRYVAGKLARKRNSQIQRGKHEIWASGIIYSVGQVNFLFDKSFEPYQSADDICQYFETKKRATSQKAKLIPDLIDMNDYWDPEYSTSRMISNDPFKKIVDIKGWIFILIADFIMKPYHLTIIEKGIIHMYVKFESYFDGKFWCARGIGIDIFTQGKTLDDLMKNIQEAVELHYEDELEKGETLTILTLQEYEVKSHARAASC